MTEEKPLPQNWTWAKLGEVVLLNPRTTFEGIDDDEQVTFIGMAAVEAESGNIDTSQTRAFKDVRRGYTGFQQGDVLFAKITPCMENGKSAVAQNLTAGVGFGSTEFHILRPPEGVNADLLRYFVGQKSFRSQAKTYMTGSAGQLRVPTTFLDNVLFPLAPTKEQKRIIEKIDTLFSETDAGLKAIERAQAKVKSFRASLLRAATSGELSAQWRAENPDVETGAVLLERILNERRAAWEEKERAKRAAKSSSKKLFEDESWKRSYSPPQAPANSDLAELPVSWTWASLEQLGTVERGKSRHRPRNDPRLFGGPYPFVQTGDVRHAETYLLSYEQTYSDFGLTQSRLWPRGTLCITIAANIAETAILGFDACFPDSVVGFIGWKSETLTRYIEFYFRTIQQRLELVAPATAQKNINLDILRLIATPLPPLAEQEWIVSEVERRLSLASEVEQTLDAAYKRAQSLKSIILARAFRGELSEQDPSEESADILLEKIRLARIEAQIEAKTQRKPRTPKMPKNTSTNRRPLLEVLHEAGGELSPEKLFQAAKYAPETIDDFYADLREEVDENRIGQERQGSTFLLRALTIPKALEEEVT